MLLATFEIGAAYLRSVTEIALKSPLQCVNRSSTRYSFRAGAKAILYNVTQDELIKHSSKNSTPIRVIGSLLIVVYF